MKKAIVASGKRKRAVARATIKEGAGKIRVNGVLLDNVEPRLLRMKLREPLLIAEKYASSIDVSVKVFGGGIMSQGDAARLAIARGLMDFTKSNALRKEFLAYDRNLLVADIRRKETCKPNDSKARAKRQKSYR